MKNTKSTLCGLALSLLAAAALFSGCTSIDYVGEEYPPTTKVDLFFSEDDITREYKVMGHLLATAEEGISAEKMQKDIKKKAMEKGADGVVVLGFEKYVSGEETKYTETTEEGTTKKGDAKTTTTATTTTKSKEKKQIKAILVKYI